MIRLAAASVLVVALLAAGAEGAALRRRELRDAVVEGVVLCADDTTCGHGACKTSADIQAQAQKIDPNATRACVCAPEYFTPPEQAGAAGPACDQGRKAQLTAFLLQIFTTIGGVIYLGWPAYGVGLGVVTGVACAGCCAATKLTENNSDGSNDGCNCMGYAWGWAFLAMYLASLIQIGTECVSGWTGADGELERAWIACESW